jgi:hypothetical protein
MVSGVFCALAQFFMEALVYCEFSLNYEAHYDLEECKAHLLSTVRHFECRVKPFLLQHGTYTDKLTGRVMDLFAFQAIVYFERSSYADVHRMLCLWESWSRVYGFRFGELLDVRGF